MFKKWFGKKDTETKTVLAPEIMGLRLGGAFELVKAELTRKTKVSEMTCIAN